MVTRDEIELTEEELRLTRERGRHVTWLISFAGMAALAFFAIPVAALGGRLVSGPWQWPATGLLAAVVGLPVIFLSNIVAWKQSNETAAVMDSLRTDLKEALRVAEEQAGRRESEAKQQEFESRLANALEMADGEPEVIEVVERAISSTLPGSPVELLLADNSHAHLTRMAVSSVVDGAPMCGVDSPDRCPAARRAQVQRFEDSEALDACPKLRGRAGGRCSAVCVPVSIMGRTVGVVHATGEPHVRLGEVSVQDLGTLAKLAGARIGMLRMVADTQLQAATDSLTGLLNRRSLENKFRLVRDETTTVSAVMADLDHFKQLNDTFGHDTGDRTLRLFAQTLSSSMRAVDLVCRQGGEEFAVLMPGCSAADAAIALEHVRLAVAAAADRAGLPPVTASFGIVEAETTEDLAEILARADAALFQAKRDGRDRVVVHDDAGRAVETDAELLAVLQPRTRTV